MSDELFLIDDEESQQTQESFKVLIVDDEESIHIVTKTALKNKLFQGKSLEIFSAYSAQEAKEILRNNDDIALGIIDVVMENPESGLELVEYIRNEMAYAMIRLVLRTGQPSQAPEEYVINKYDINDYKEKTELTAQKLYTLVRTSIKQFAQLQELKESRDETYKKMVTSELTGLPNRVKLNERLDSEGEKSLILVNIDDFSMINDTQGFEVGDKLLQRFAHFLRDSYPSAVEVYHLDRDIFALLCFSVNDKDLEKCSKALKLKVTRHQFAVDNLKLHITVSLGIVLHETGNLIQKAEFAIKEARNLGKNKSKVYTNDLNIIRTIYANSKWTEHIREALEADKIHAYFQAIQSCKTGKIEKYEALARLEYEEKIYTPYYFLDAAFYSGYIYDIFKIMFEKTCEMAYSSSYDFSVNVSEYDLKEESFYTFVSDIIQQKGIKKERISFEILEYKSISNDQQVKDLIHKLHEDGFKISIDDFGTQCSNFAQLNDLPIDFIKIDGSFIKNIVTDKDSQIISQTITDYAKLKGVPIIAEFVCEEVIYDYVEKMDIEYAQGYYIGEPSATLL